MSNVKFIKSISELHKLVERDKPDHPLISIEYFDGSNTVGSCCDDKNARYVLDLYQIILDEEASGSLRYGRSSYDFEEGSLVFMKPGQVFYSDGSYKNYNNKGWVLCFHPDLIRQSELGKNIDQYTFISYEANEALHLSEKEKQFLLNIVNTIESEYQQNIDRHSQELIVTNLKLLLDYSKRYYDRQFYTRTSINKDLVSRFENLLTNYYSSNKQLELGIPTVRYCGIELGLSPNYLSDLLKKETGRNAIDHIHLFIIEKAKTELLKTTESISQIAYNLGFEHAPYFSRLFKKKTGLSPKEYILNSAN